MLVKRTRFLFCTTIVLCSAWFCDGQFFSSRNAETTMKPLPFPACRADNVECLRRGLRTFFFFMNSGYLGMKKIDPIILNSISIALPEEQMSFLMRKVNVSGAKWTKLIDRKFNLEGGRSNVRFFTDLHVTGDLSMTTAERTDPLVTHITMDINEVESNITYAWTGEHGIDDEEYILIGKDRIVIRNSRTPTYFLQPDSEDATAIDEAFKLKTSILEHISNEITMVVMQTIMENFRHFARLVPVKDYYLLYSN